MQRFTVITLFPELVEVFRRVGIVRRACESGIVSVDAVNPREFAPDRRGTVDDAPYGGGPGMVMSVPPLRTAIATARARHPGLASHVAYLSPQGRRFGQGSIARLAGHAHLVLLAGRYEGVDERLIARSARRDRSAYAELWRRHQPSALAAARRFTWIDADDLVAEAFTRIYACLLDGKGPRGPFRPYLYTTVRNLAARWGASAKEIAVDNVETLEAPQDLDDPVVHSLDRTLTARAFRSLPPRWQSVLWYTEVEELDPHDVAPIM
ncbi:MAG: sigma factor, partial [Gammaproteobacteria bacterium]